ncbi:MAG: hypothetical protein JWP88_1893 [Flaviaesturariibacter sp.]|nr:hypothetical protein [Flaviaesturariibacter sp.]
MKQFNSGKPTLLVIILLAIVLPICPVCQAQNIIVVSKSRIYKQQILTDSNLKMVELKSVMPDIMYDLRYGSINNFMQRKLYTQHSITFLRMPVAIALKSIQDKLRKQGLGLKIFDAYRPYSVTKKMWDLIHDERYVADPAKGSGHNRGIAVDLTIINLKTGLELPMGTGFDSFTDTAHHSFMGLPSDITANRILLKRIMEEAGFKPLETEWWHYSWTKDRVYDVLDLAFKRLVRY